MFDFFGTEKRRKNFTVATKKIEWMKAAGRDPDEYIKNKKFYKTSKCRQCGLKLTWGDRRYDFDHKDNNSSNNSQKNCYLVCKTCHGGATKIEKQKVRDPFFGDVVGHKTIKRKVGYKKPKKTIKTAKKKTTKKEEDFFWF